MGKVVHLAFSVILEKASLRSMAFQIVCGFAGAEELADLMVKIYFLFEAGGRCHGLMYSAPRRPAGAALWWTLQECAGARVKASTPPIAGTNRCQ